MKRLFWTAANIVALLMCLILLSGGLVIYQSQQYGYVFRKKGARPGIEFQCFVQSTHTQKRNGLILWDRDAAPYTLAVKAYDLNTGKEVAIRCNELIVNGVAQVGQGNNVLPLGLSYQNDAKVVVDVSITVPGNGDDANSFAEQLSGTAVRQRAVTRVWPYWWFCFRKGWAG
jgi:hypothetical protein